MFFLLKKNPHLILFCLSVLITEIGMGLTQVSVYGSLSSANVAPFWYGFAFFLSLFPGFISSFFINRLINRFSLHIIHIGINLSSGFFLLFPLYESLIGNIAFLLVALFVSSFASGFLYTLIQTYIKRACADADLPAFAKIDSLLFTANIVIGIGLGTLFYSFLGTSVYLILNILLYILSSVIIYLCFRTMPALMAAEVNPKKSDNHKFKLSQLTTSKKISFLYMPVLSFVTAPLMSLLPLIGQNHGKNFPLLNIFLVNTAIATLCAKSFGQTIGPLITRKSWFTKLSTDLNKFMAIIAVFPVCYILAFYIRNFYVSLLLIMLAHIFSNIIATVGFYIFQKYFERSELPHYASLQYRIIIFIASFSALFSGFIFEKTSFLAIAIVPMASVFLLYIISHKKLLLDNNLKQVEPQRK